MAFCKYTEQIYDYECLGDSLQKINQNFSNLNAAVCEIPEPMPGPGISLDFDTTEQYQSVVTINAENSFDYRTTFESYDNGAELELLSLSDITNLQVTHFPYNSNPTANKPTATFSTVARAKSCPQVTLYWMASGQEIHTTYPLNSSASDDNRGNTWFNDTVSCMLSAPEGLYVGGSFESVGGSFAQKLALIDTTAAGQLTSVPIPFLGSIGEVRDIKKATIIVNSVSNELLIVGGTFESIGTNGRAFVIYNKTANILYPWYVNGEVNALEVFDGNLYVGGSFDFINYGSLAASVASGQRFNTNGFVAINLAAVISGLADSSLSDFSVYLSKNATIYSFARYQYALYIGGKFQIRSENKLTHQNLYSIDLTPLSITDPTYVPPWTPVSRFRPLVSGPVYTLYIDNLIANGGSVYLYVGGNFSRIYTHSQFYSNPRSKNLFVNAYNAFVVQLTNLTTTKTIPDILTNWRPKFNGPVLNFVSHDNNVESYIYCYGQYSVVNGEAVSHIAGIGKASSTVLRGKVYPHWKPGIQNGPSVPNKALLRDNSALIIGGNFTKISKHYRYNLGKISCIDLSLPSPPTVVWDCGGQIVSQNNLFTFDMYASTTSRVSSIPFEMGQLNATVFAAMSEGFKEITPGQLLRFFIRRPGKACDTDDTFTNLAYAVGWKVDFNNLCNGSIIEQ